MSCTELSVRSFHGLSPTVQPALSGRRVLVAASCPDARRRYESALTDAGAEVTPVGAPASAVAAVDARLFDAILIALPAGDAASAARRFRRDGFSGFILAVTEDGPPSPTVDRDGGADDYVPPFADPAQLPGRLADGLLRARNAANGTVSPSGFDRR